MYHVKHCFIYDITCKQLCPSQKAQIYGKLMSPQEISYISYLKYLKTTYAYIM